MKIDDVAAKVYASWFKCLSEPTRVVILNRLANSERPMSVAELVAEVNVGQSTVSHHLKVLAEVGFVLVEHRANQSLYEVNEHCLVGFPSAAELVMGHLPAVGAGELCVPPWLTCGETSGAVQQRPGSVTMPTTCEDQT